MTSNDAKQLILKWIDTNANEFFQAADSIWNYPELGMEEYNSSSLLIELLQKYGFTVDKGVAGMPTAFVATYGNKGPVIGFSAEYDCLPGLSQEVGTEKKPIVPGAPGQGCGHNLLGVGAACAAIALKQILEEKKIPAVVKLFGTPAEELCVGKPLHGQSRPVRRRGYLPGLAPLELQPGADYDACNAYFNVKYHFKGRTSPRQFAVVRPEHPRRRYAHGPRRGNAARACASFHLRP